MTRRAEIVNALKENAKMTETRNPESDEYDFLELDRAMKIRAVVEKYGEDSFYLSFSGGRDSTVLSAFLDVVLPNNTIPRVFADTGIELNAVREFVKAKAESDDRIVMLKPKVNVMESLRRDGYPFKSKTHSLWVSRYQSGHPERYKAMDKYLGKEEGYGSRFSCPKSLMYQFSPDFTLKVSDACCRNMKEQPLIDWQNQNGRSVAITAILAAEGGRRMHASKSGCLTFNGKSLRFFHPFKVVDDEFFDYLIAKYDIELCKLYYPPYNFKRTGCKGCPFNIRLQDELDTLERFFPNERAQCERIWEPVYNEYRRIGYRLKQSK